MSKKNLELAKAIRHKLFAERKTVKEAWDYAFDVLNSLRESDRMAATAAMMVLLNTISKQIIENETSHPLAEAFLSGDHVAKNEWQ